MADRGTEKFIKRLMGKTEVDDGLQRLDMLTKEENLMTAARTLQVTSDIHHDVNVIKEDTRNINNLERGASHHFHVFIHVPILITR